MDEAKHYHQIPSNTVTLFSWLSDPLWIGCPFLNKPQELQDEIHATKRHSNLGINTSNVMNTFTKCSAPTAEKEHFQISLPPFTSLCLLKPSSLFLYCMEIQQSISNGGKEEWGWGNVFKHFWASLHSLTDWGTSRKERQGPSLKGPGVWIYFS